MITLLLFKWRCRAPRAERHSDELHNDWSQNGNKENFHSDRDMASSVAQPDSIALLVAIEACVPPEKPRFTDDETIIAITGSRTTK